MFFQGAILALDPLISFGVKKVAEILQEDDSPGTLSYGDFASLAHKLRRRELTGHAARDEIHQSADKSNVSLWNEFYRRILLKDLKCGVESSTINKVLKKISQAYPDAVEFIIPLFECQLAHDGNTDQHTKKVKGLKFLDVKLDGVRLLTVLDKEQGTVTQYTRNGKVNDSFPHITEALTELLKELPGSVVLDGEIVGASFQELMTQLNRKTSKNAANAKLALFDIIPLDDFKKGACATTQSIRHDMLVALAESGMLAKHAKDFVYVIPKVLVDLDTPEGQIVFKEFNKKAIEAGYEGIMVKDPDAPYLCKRSVGWLKIKPFIEVSLSVTGVEEGKPDGKYVGMLGALVCEGEDDGRIIKVNVGSGFTDKQRQEFWVNQSKLIGMIAEVCADALSKPQDGDVWSLRFPSFKGFRGFEPGEKI